MDKARSVKNIVTAIVFKIVLLFLGIFTIRFLIQYTGNEINGLNSLFKSIVGFLSIAELGVGTAISYCMYKPIIAGDTDSVAALYKLFKKIYWIIGAIIAAAGLVLMPFLPLLANDYTVDVNIYFTFALMLVSVVISYMYSAESSLINAYKNNYITTIVSSTGMVIQQGLQILSLILFRSFEIFLVCRIVAILLQWAATALITKKSHADILSNKTKSLAPELKKAVTSNIKAMFMHKVGGVLVNSVSSIVISAACGLVILGKYSNYVSIMTSMVALLVLFFTPLTSIIGHLYVESGKDELKKYFNFFYCFNYVLGAVFFLGYYAIIDSVVALFYGSNLGLSLAIKVAITLNYFVQFLRQSVLLFRDATGTFYYDRWKPLIEGVCNLLLSICFVLVLPEELKILGVVGASIITNILICHIVEPFVLYKHAFKSSPKKYFIQNYIYIGIFCLMIVAFELINITHPNIWLDLLINGCLSVLVSLFAVVLVFVINSDFRHYFKIMFKKLLFRK